MILNINIDINAVQIRVITALGFVQIDCYACFCSVEAPLKNRQVASISYLFGVYVSRDNRKMQMLSNGLQFTENTPSELLCHPATRGKFTHPFPNSYLFISPLEIRCYWWRRRESNPRPEVLLLRYYMFSLCFYFRIYPAHRQAVYILSGVIFHPMSPRKQHQTILSN